MDLLFREYASPFILLDEVIKVGELNNFLDTFSKKQEEKAKWEIYLYKLGAFDSRSFEEFCSDIDRQKPKQAPEREELETTIKNSHEILKHFEI